MNDPPSCASSLFMEVIHPLNTFTSFIVKNMIIKKEFDKGTTYIAQSIERLK